MQGASDTPSQSPGQKRKLATILAADAVEFSRMMAADEEATVRVLRAHREVIDKLIGRHDGRIFNTAGDSVLAEFDSPVEAVRAAITIQDELRLRNAELVEARQMHFRIGINVGDVLVDGDNLLGDGVNIAARLEGIAAPGGVCISGSTFEQVKNKLSVGFQDLGPQQVRNIPDPVSAFGLTSAPVSVVGGDTPAPAARMSPAAAIVVALVLLLAGGGTAYWWFQAREGGPVAALPTAKAPAPAKQAPTPAKKAPAPAAKPPAPKATAPPAPRPTPPPAVKNDPPKVAALPPTRSTKDMRAAEVEAFMAGLTIEGTRRDGLPFKIVVKPNKTISYQFAGNGEVGKWWAEDWRFCMKVRRFAQGKKICPPIVETGETITAFRRDGTARPWSITR